MGHFRIFGVVLITLLIAVPLSIWASTWYTKQNGDWLSPLGSPAPAKPLLQYSIPNLAQREYVGDSIRILSTTSETPEVSTYVYTVKTLGRTMTGQLNIPAAAKQSNLSFPAIVMIRGYVPPETYQTGVGTKNAALAFAKAGYVTIAPDFFGYGQSDPEPPDVWQARFEKPMVITELIQSLKTQGVPISPIADAHLPIAGIGIWAHSNGGQIALTTLEVLGQPIPTTLWAPVNAPFPYSILFFSDENDDEGKAARQSVAELEKVYDVFEFSLTKHLDRLTGPIQLHHGTADESALKAWSDEWVDKVKAENRRRTQVVAELATASAAPESETVLPTAPLPPVDLTYYTYPGADHNLQPGWATAIERDLAFFREHIR